MSSYYFAYGSNMNPQRMAERGLKVIGQQAGKILGLRLAFNKRCAQEPTRSYANVMYDREGCVEGVLYKLSDPNEIIKMDPFEGAPRLYSREIYWVDTGQEPIAAWVYVANKAMLTEGLKPQGWYLEHLLAGKPFLTESYFDRLAATAILDTITS